MVRDAEFERAAQAALRLLAYRARGIEELRRRLREKGFGASLSDAVIDDLIGRGLLDDESFAYEWARAHAVHRLWTDVRIAAGLREKGVPRDVIRRAVARVREEFTEHEAAARIIAKKTGALAARGLRRQNTKKRMAQNLLGRGFAPSVVYEVLRDRQEDERDIGE